MISKLFLKYKDVVEFDELLSKLDDVATETVRTVKSNGIALDNLKEQLSHKKLPQRH